MGYFVTHTHIMESNFFLLNNLIHFFTSLIFLGEVTGKFNTLLTFFLYLFSTNFTACFHTRHSGELSLAKLFGLKNKI